MLQLLTASNSEFAALSGLPSAAGASLDSHKVRSISKRTLPSENTGGQATHDPAEDDEPAHPTGTLTHSHKSSADTTATAVGHRFPPAFSNASTHSQDLPQGHALAQPKVSVRAEHPAVTRQAEKDKKCNLTCLVTIEMPTRLHLAPQSSSSPALPSSSSSSKSLRSSNSTAHLAAAQRLEPKLAPPSSDKDQRSLRVSSPGPTGTTEPVGYSYSATTSTSGTLQADMGSPKSFGEPDAFESILKDLQSRMSDWKGHSPDEFGRLHMFDLLHVRKDKKA